MRKRHIVTMALAAAITTGSAASLTACSARIAEGTVIAKNFQPAHTVLTTILVGKHTVLMPHIDPADYRIEVRGTDIDHKPSTQWIDVDEADYHKLTVGSHYRGAIQ